MTSSQAYSGIYSSKITGVYVLSETTLKTKMKQPAKAERRDNYPILSITALKTFVRSEIPTK
jgi:hypothetical protein